MEPSGALSPPDPVLICSLCAPDCSAMASVHAFHPRTPRHCADRRIPVTIRRAEINYASSLQANEEPLAVGHTFDELEPDGESVGEPDGESVVNTTRTLLARTLLCRRGSPDRALNRLRACEPQPDAADARTTRPFENQRCVGDKAGPCRSHEERYTLFIGIRALSRDVEFVSFGIMTGKTPTMKLHTTHFLSFSRIVRLSLRHGCELYASRRHEPRAHSAGWVYCGALHGLVQYTAPVGDRHGCRPGGGVLEGWRRRPATTRMH